MTVYRKWFCTCTGKPVEIEWLETAEEDNGEPTCERCGASVSADPKKTISFRDQENWDD